MLAAQPRDNAPPMTSPQDLKAAIDTLLAEGGRVPEGWLVVFLAPAEGTPVEEAATALARLFKALAGKRRLLVGGNEDTFRPRPHILHRIVVKNAREERYDYFFFPDDSVVISGYWGQTFPVLFRRRQTSAG